MREPAWFPPWWHHRLSKQASGRQAHTVQYAYRPNSCYYCAFVFVSKEVARVGN